MLVPAHLLDLGGFQFGDESEIAIEARFLGRERATAKGTILGDGGQHRDPNLANQFG
jgi:hypothetical protein